MLPVNATNKYLRIVAWVVGIGAVLLIAGYLTADQWIALVSGLL